MLVSGRSASPQRGFTAIEGLVVILIVAVLAAVALPNLRSFIANSQSKAASQDVVADMTLARSEAIKRNLPVTVTANEGNWAKGWAVSADGTTLRTRAALPDGVTVSGVGGSTLTFGTNGRLSADTVTSLQKWTIKSSATGVQERCVVITPTGAARSKTGAC